MRLVRIIPVSAVASVALLFYFNPNGTEFAGEVHEESAAMANELQNESFSFLVAADAHYGQARFFAVKVRDGQMLVAGWKEDGWSRHWIVDL